jgi:hypothetical protein
MKDIEKNKKIVKSKNGVIVEYYKVKEMVEGSDRRNELG